MVTLHDIAKKLNLSASTVSRALNNSSKISKQTREHVEKVAAQMHYTGRPHKNKQESNNIIGIICPEIISYNYSSVVESITQSLHRKGYTSIISLTNFDQQVEEALLNLYEKMRVAGIILIMYKDAASISILEQFRRRSDIPIVQIANFEEHKYYDSLMISNRYAAEMIVNHLYQLGHRDFGIITDIAATEREEAILTRLHELGIVPKKANQIVIENKRFEDAGYAGAFRILQNNRPTALIATYDYIAIGILKACCEMNIRVPEDLSVASIDNISTSKFLNKALTTVSMPHADMGSIAARIIINRIKRRNDSAQAIQHVSLNPVLISGETTSECR